MKIKLLNRKKLYNALPLVWKVFCDYEAVNYPEIGKKVFWDAIHSDEYLNSLTAYGAYENRKLIGIIATRNSGSHIALFFVDGNYHRQGIGRKLWNTVLSENTSQVITVHSSFYAVPIYEKLGFLVTGDVQSDRGIQYVPMEYQMVINNDCPCKKINCVRHGDVTNAKHTTLIPKDCDLVNVTGMILLQDRKKKWRQVGNIWILY